LDLRGHNATVTAGTVTMGVANPSSLTGAAFGVINFDTGTFTATTLNMGQRTGATSTADLGTGTPTFLNQFNVGGGFLTVTGTTTISANAMTALSTGLTGNLNVTGGTVTLGAV